MLTIRIGTDTPHSAQLDSTAQIAALDLLVRLRLDDWYSQLRGVLGYRTPV